MFTLRSYITIPLISQEHPNAFYLFNIKCEVFRDRGTYYFLSTGNYHYFVF